MNWFIIIILAIFVIVVIWLSFLSKVNGRGSKNETAQIKRKLTQNKRRLRHEIRRFNARVYSETEKLKESKKDESGINLELRKRFNSELRGIISDLNKAGFRSGREIKGLVGSSEFRALRKARNIIE
jgi:hypothetical protein